MKSVPRSVHDLSSIAIVVALIAVTMLLAHVAILAYSEYNTGVYRPVPGGVRIVVGNWEGTSGYVVEDPSTGARYLLIAYHVVYKGGSNDVYQPDSSTDYYLIGSVTRYNMEVDAALVKANEELSVSFDPRVRLPDGSFVSFSGVVAWDSLEDYENNAAEFMGIASGPTVVSIIGKYYDYYYVDPDTGTVWDYKYLVVFSPSALPGDSGAPLWILSWGGNLLVGHVVLRLSSNSAAAVSASEIFEYLGVTPVTGG